MAKCYIKKREGFYEREEWIDKYSEYLRKLYIPKEDRDARDIYNDPDVVGNCSEFYYDLTCFLNKREMEMKGKLKEEYSYEFCKNEYPWGIKVIKDGIVIFRLRSDQFGFSAPSLEKNHPYDVYLEKCIEENIEVVNVAINNVAGWIFDSRSIGGSFLWPIQKNSNGKYSTHYNLIRGGSKKAGSYIEDRVDLTLFEIKHTFEADYEEKYKNDILYTLYTNIDNEKNYIREWLEHFVCFENYIEFFMMNNFVKDEIPLDIVKSKLCEGANETLNENRKKIREIYNLDFKDLDRMLKNVNKLIINRTERIGVRYKIPRKNS